MKKVLLVGAFALLAACGSSKSGVSVGTTGDSGAAASSPATQATGSDQTATSDTSSDTGSDDTATEDSSSDETIPIKSLGDMPKECISLLSDFLKKIEPLVKDKDWSKATVNDLEALGTQFDQVSTEFDTKSAANGCDKYNITGSDKQSFEQIIALAQAEAPGTVKFLQYLFSFSQSVGGSNSGGSTTGSLPGNCDDTIAAIEPYLSSGKTMKDLTLDELTKVSSLMASVATLCPPDQAAAFYQREDVVKFTGS